MPNPSDTTSPYGHQLVEFIGVLNIADTTSKLLFTLPAASVITGGKIIPWATASNYTTATLSIGVLGGAGTEYLANFNIQAAAGGSNGTPIYPTWTNFGAQASNYGTLGGVSYGSNSIGVVGKVAASGSSVQAGPWTVVFEVITA